MIQLRGTVTEAESPAIRGARRLYLPALRWALGHRAVVVAGATVLLAVSALLAGFGQSSANGRAWLDARRNRWIAGTPDEARAMVARYADAGIERIMLQDFLPHDGEMIDLMAAELIGRA